MEKQKGLILVYTGNGKGKTTAALGLALRAIGHGQQIFMIQFKKGNIATGEVKAIRKFLPAFEIVQAGKNIMSPDGVLADDSFDVVQEGFKQGKEALFSGKYDLVIFDEINIVLDRGLLAVRDVVEMLARRPEYVNVVLTGRNAPAEIIAIADLVSEVKEVKHYYRSGVKARTGLEF